MIIEDLPTERRLLASLLTEPAVLAGAGDLETQDFTDYRHWVVFAAIRQLQAESHDVGVIEVDEILAQRDRAYGSFLRERCGAAFMAELILESGPYNHAVLWEHDMWWLKQCGRLRRALEACA